MLPTWATDTVTRHRPTTVSDGHGNVIANWTSTDDAVITGCSVQPGPSAEILGGRDASITDWTVYAPYGADVTVTDLITYAGIRYWVNGQPLPQKSPTGRLSHTVIELRRVEG